jgi:hypothetical protein
VEGTNCGEEDEEAHAAGYWEDGRRGTARSWLAAGTADEEALGSEWRGRIAPEEGGRHRRRMAAGSREGDGWRWRGPTGQKK